MPATHSDSDTTPDLSLYRLVHRAMRGDAFRLERAVVEIDRGDRRRAAALQRWFAGYLGELHDHHTIEDDVFFPAVAAKVPGFADDLARIDRDHALLDELLQATSRSLHDLTGEGASWARAQADATRATRELAHLIDTHLGFEDDEVLPLFTQHLTASEYTELEERATANPDLKQAAFTVPWVLAWATDEERRDAFAKSPFVFQLLWRARRRPYARLARRAFADAAAVDPVRR